MEIGIGWIEKGFPRRKWIRGVGELGRKEKSWMGGQRSDEIGLGQGDGGGIGAGEGGGRGGPVCVWALRVGVVGVRRRGGGEGGVRCRVCDKNNPSSREAGVRRMGERPSLSPAHSLSPFPCSALFLVSFPRWLLQSAASQQQLELSLWLREGNLAGELDWGAAVARSSRKRAAGKGQM